MQGHRVTDEELKSMQRICLEMLMEIDRVCRKYKIQYSIDGGTLLGAVRHKGFIPWDDDVDVIMKRDQYVKFRRACKKELDKTRFFLQDYTTDPEYRWGYAKLRRNNTIQMRSGQEHLKQHTGVFLDIFVVDNVPDNYIARRIHYFQCFCIRKLQYSPVGALNEKNPALRFWYKLLSIIPRKAAFHWRNKLAYKWNKRSTELISHYTFPYFKRCKYGLPAECFDNYIDMEFEGKTVRGFEKYDLYLTKLYGNYMVLPPVEERVSHVEYSRLELIDVEI